MDDASGAGDVAARVDLEPHELSGMLERDAPVFLLDVREPWESQVAPFTGARLVPLRTLSDALESIPRDRDIVAICHHGVRSARAVSLLREAGFTRVHNLVGGIDRWSLEADPSVPRY